VGSGGSGGGGGVGGSVGVLSHVTDAATIFAVP
jgi:hypothetical protein